MYGWLIRTTLATRRPHGVCSSGTPRPRSAFPVLLTERSLDQALGLDGGLDEETLDDFLRRVKTPPGDADQS
jgi:hypothetical protein